MLKAEGKYEESLKYYLKCKQIAEEYFLFNHLEVAAIYINLADLLESRGNYEESFKYQLKCKQSIEQELYFNDFSAMYNTYLDSAYIKENSNCNKTPIKDEVYIKKFENMKLKENRKNAQHEYNLLNELKNYKNFFVEPLCLKFTNKGALLIMKKVKCSMFTIKKQIIKGNKILFSEREIKVMLQQIIEAYDILKKQKIVHSDVHPGNILIDFDNKAKLCDFEFSYKYIKEIEKNNEPLILPNQNKFTQFLAPELLFWSRKLSSKHEPIRYDPFKSDIFSIGLCILFLIHSDFKDVFDLKGFNDYNFDINSEADRKKRDNIILKLFELGTAKFKLEYHLEYGEYNAYALRLQKKINKKIKSLRGYKSIRKILQKMMKVHFPDREDIDKLLMRIKIINFDIPLEELKLQN